MKKGHCLLIILLTCGMGLFGCQGSHNGIDLGYVRLDPTDSQIEEALGRVVAPVGGGTLTGVIHRIGSLPNTAGRVAEPLCLRYELLGSAMGSRERIGRGDDALARGGFVNYVLDAPDGFRAVLSVYVAHGTQFRDFDDDPWRDFWQEVSSYADPVALGRWDWSADELNRWIDDGSLIGNDGPCGSSVAAAGAIAGLPSGVAGYLEVGPASAAAGHSGSPGEPSNRLNCWSSSLYTVVDGEWSAIVTLNTWGLAEEARDWVLEADLLPVLDLTVAAVRENGPDVLKAKQPPSLEEAIAYLEG